MGKRTHNIMLSTIKKHVPTQIKRPIRNAIKTVKYTHRKHKIQAAVKSAINSGAPLKIIVGAAETYQPGWYSTNEQWLDITQQKDWDNIFKNQPCLTHIVAEHVFEHLTTTEAAQALRHMHQYLLPGGRVRIAVPDGNNPDPEYIRHVGINGIGDDAADHKQLLTTKTLSKLIQDAGFTAQHIEGYDKNGQLIQTPYDIKDGFIMRSRANDNHTPWTFPDANTSLIVDGVK